MIRHRFYALFIRILILSSLHTHAQNAQIQEVAMPMNTYMFSEPNPIPEMNNIYPYFRFDGYTNQAKEKEWNMVVMENDYIQVFVCPEIGGKVWGAIEKSTGKEFLYYNRVVKFRDVAMRGAWTSGGLEYNFGDIGHIPTCATPVDYRLKEYDDGSVSCIVGAMDIPSRSMWKVEIVLPKDKAYFETKAAWFNHNPLPITYYHWMNAAAKAEGELEFIYPGNKRIGHGGEVGEWPMDYGRNISHYENNDFGVYKSYHVLNAYANFFGGYWHEDAFGFGHVGRYDDKPGKKIWIWGLSDQGMIWEDLLTDTNGQYVEYQAGKLFNQAAHNSIFTPFKHQEFSPYDADLMSEIWFPLKETGGMDAASQYAVLKVEREKDAVQLLISALANIDAELKVQVEGKLVQSERVELKPLEKKIVMLEVEVGQSFELALGNDLLYYNSDEEQAELDRPLVPHPKMDWHSAFGLYTLGWELEKQRRYTEALEQYLLSLNQEPAFLPALNRAALAYYRQMEYDSCLTYIRQSLSINTYDPLANYIYGLVHVKAGSTAEAKSGFSIASQSPHYRTAAYTELAQIYVKEGKLAEAKVYAQKAIEVNQQNIPAWELLALIARIEGDEKAGESTLATLSQLNPIHPFLLFEEIQWGKRSVASFQEIIVNELAFESYLELAIRYVNLGRITEAMDVLAMAPEQAIVNLWAAYVTTEEQSTLISKALDLPAEMVFPHRIETAEMLEELQKTHSHWKLDYYLSLIDWKKGRIAEAKALFQACEDKPNFPAFYLAKANLFAEDQDVVLAALERAWQLDSTDWRVDLAWLERYMDQSNFPKVESFSKELIDQHPEKSVFGIMYAKSLLAQQKYDEGISFLAKYVILPYEGSTEGRSIYHETCIRKAYKALVQRKYQEAIQAAEQAKQWPKNLGVGRPYEVDERLEHFLMGLAYDYLGQSTEAASYFEQVKQHQTSPFLSENMHVYLQAILLKRDGQLTEAQALIQQSLEADPEDATFQEIAELFASYHSDQGEESMVNRSIPTEDEYGDIEWMVALGNMLTSP